MKLTVYYHSLKLVPINDRIAFFEFLPKDHNLSLKDTSLLKKE